MSDLSTKFATILHQNWANFMGYLVSRATVSDEGALLDGDVFSALCARGVTKFEDLLPVERENYVLQAEELLKAFNDHIDSMSDEEFDNAICEALDELVSC